METRAGVAAALRVRLLPPRASDEQAVSEWLPEALSAVDGRGRAPYPPVRLGGLQQALLRNEELLLVVLTDDQPVGVLVLADEAATTRIDRLAIAAPLRNLGLGAEAVYAAEALRSSRFVLAGVPLQNGLAIYFWLRVGYRPLYPSPETAALPPGRLWMRRNICPLPYS